MKRFTTALLVAGFLTGCAGLPGLTTTPGGGTTANPTGTKPGSTSNPGANAPGTSVAVEPLQTLNGVSFVPISAESSKFLSQNNGGIVAAGGGNAVSSNGAQGLASNAAGPASNMAAPVAASMDMTESNAGSSAGLVSNHGGVMGKMAPPSANGPVQSVGGAYSGNTNAYYGYGYYFGGMGGWDNQMSLVSIHEAKTAGAAGTFQEIIAKAVAPMVAAWDPNARMVESGAVLDNDGKIYVETQVSSSEPVIDLPMTKPMPMPAVAPTAAGAPPSVGATVSAEGGATRKLMSVMGMPMPYMGGGNENGWRLTYVSTTKTEAMTFTVTAKQTTIIKMHWAPLNLAPERVLVDSGKAIRSLIAAIEDKGFAGAEEKSGNDYFLGFKFDQPGANGGMSYPGDYDSGSRTEVVYKVPGNARWNASLQQVMGKLVWDLNYWAEDTSSYGRGGSSPPMMAMSEPAGMSEDDAGFIATNASTVVSNGGGGMIAPSPGKEPYCKPEPQVKKEMLGHFNNSASGMIDAATGTVIRFSRPTRYYYTDHGYQNCAYPEDTEPQPEPQSDCEKPEAAPTIGTAAQGAYSGQLLPAAYSKLADEKAVTDAIVRELETNWNCFGASYAGAAQVFKTLYTPDTQTK